MTLNGSFANIPILKADNGGTIRIASVTINNEGEPLSLEGTTGNFDLIASTLRNMIVTSTFNSKIIMRSNSTLDNVTLDADFDIGNILTLTVRNGLTLNSTVTLLSGGNLTGLDFVGDQLLMGTGEIVFAGTFGANLVRPIGGSLTIGENITIRGRAGEVGDSSFPLVNLGTIRAEISGQSIVVRGASGSSSPGSIEATDGGIAGLTGSFVNVPKLRAENLGIVRLTSLQLNNGGQNLNLDGSAGIFEILNSTLLDTTVTGPPGRKLTAVSSNLIGNITLNVDLDIQNARIISVRNGLTLNGTVTLFSGGGLTGMDFVGDQLLNGTGEIVFAGTFGANLVRPVGGSLTIGENITIRGRAGEVGDSSFPLVNLGTIRAEISGQSIVVRGASGSSSPGSIEATDGGIAGLTGSFVNVPKLRAENLGIVRLTSLQLNNGGQNLNLDGSAGIFEILNSTLLDTTVTGPPGRKLTAVSSNLIGNITLNVDLDIQNARIISVRNGLTLNGTVTLFSGGGLTGMDFVGDQLLNGTGEIVFAGTFGANLVRPVGGSLTIGENITIRGRAGEVGDSSFLLINQGLVRSEIADQSISIRGSTVTNSGTLESKNGTLSISNLAPNEGTLHVGANGLISINGGFTNAGIGSINLDIGGTAIGEFGRLTVNGQAVLAGNLNLALVNGFSPLLNDSFQILTFTSRTGEFETLTGTVIDDNLSFSPEYSATDLLVVVIQN